MLVTARHLCTEDPEETILLRHTETNDGNAYSALARRVGINVAPAADFAIFRMETPIEVEDDIPLDSAGFFYTQPAYILGFPYGLSLQVDVASPRRMPIVKSCIISGSGFTDDGVAVLYIDTLVNPGFSGGPLVFIDLNTNQPKFAGVVAKGMWAPVQEPTDENPDPQYGPAGIGIVIRESNFRSLLP